MRSVVELIGGTLVAGGRVANRPDFRPRDFGQGTLVS